MKFIHISDLHLGKRMHGYDIMEEQRDALSQVMDCAVTNQADLVIIAGDVYDTSQPPVEAVRLLDWFLTSLAEAHIEVMMIAGNHDSADRLAFGSSLFQHARIQIAGSWQGEDIRIERQNDSEKIVFHLVPFLRPRNLRRLDSSIETENDAFRYVISTMEREPDARHVLVAHQYFSGGIFDSEQIIPGQEMVDAAFLDGFDYCALGHLHTAQQVQQPHHRYCGTLMKFSSSEANRDKSFVLVDTAPDPGNASVPFQITQIPVRPLRDLVEIRGTVEELCSPAFYSQYDRENYFSVILEDRQESYGTFDTLRRIYPRIVTMSWPNVYTRSQQHQQRTLQLDGMRLIETFFTTRTGKSMSEGQKCLMDRLWKEVEDETD